MNSPSSADPVPEMSFEGDIVYVHLVGEISLVEMQRMIDMSDQLFASNGYVLMLANAQHATGVHPAARRLQAQRSKMGTVPSHVAIYNVNLITRTIATLMQRGLDLITGKSHPISFHRDEAESRAMLAIQRPILQAKVARP